MNRVRELMILYKSLGKWNEITKEIDSMDSKHLLLSKTFWLNIAGLAATVGGILPQKYAVPVMTVVNIINRIFTIGPVNILPVK